MRSTASAGRVRVVRAAMTLSVVLLAVGCSAISPERPHPTDLKSLRVAVTKTIDTVPLRLGVQRGVFRQSGVDVQLVEVGSGASVIKAVTSGDVDAGLMCNYALLRRSSEGAEFELQGEAYISGPNTMALVTLPGRGYQTPTDEPDPVIGVEPDRGLGKLATRMRLATEGVDADRVKFTDLRFDGMISALKDDRIDAAWMTEPDISLAQKEHGAEIIMDTSRGALLEFPMSSYTATRSRATEKPQAFASFRKALARAQQLATDITAVRAELGRLTELDKTTVELVSLGSFPASLNGVRLQRVADLMHRSGAVPGRIDVASMLPPGPAA